MFPKGFACSYAVLVATILLAGFSAALSTQCDFSVGIACKPWDPTKSCGRGDSIDMRFVLDVAGIGSYDLFTNSTNPTKTYAFCPHVDELSTFSLNQSASLAGISAYDSSRLSGHPNVSYIYLYGAGGVHDAEMPSSQGDAAVVIYENSTACPNPNGLEMGGPAFVSFLVLNITLTNGYYRLSTDFDQPIQVGFMPTCDSSDSCTFGSGVCVGKPGRKNCATCLKDVSSLSGLNVKIWTSYYGTDNQGRRLTSGASNPLNFRQFAQTAVYNTVFDDVKNFEGKF